MLSVVSGGLLSTVQDQGRAAWQCYGVSAGGAMDAAAARWANRLVGNADTAAVLEITLAGPTLRLEEGRWIALAGSELEARLDEQPVQVGGLVWAPAGSTLRLGAVRGGCRSYLALSGGIDVPVVMDSRSTALRAGFGGLGGQALQAGARLPLLPSTLPPPDDPDCMQRSLWRAGPALFVGESYTTLRLIPAGELPESCLAALLAHEFTVSSQSDRMGLRLSGHAIARPNADLRLSSGLAFGSVQLPPDGHPIILGADRQSTGGYPLLGTIASVDHGRIAQLRPGARLAFSLMSLETAHAALYRQQEMEARALFMLREYHRSLFSAG